MTPDAGAGPWPRASPAAIDPHARASTKPSPRTATRPIFRPSRITMFGYLRLVATLDPTGRYALDSPYPHRSAGAAST